MLIEKDDGIERLVLGACGNLLIRGEVRNILRYFFFSQFFWVALTYGTV